MVGGQIDDGDDDDPGTPSSCSQLGMDVISLADSQAPVWTQSTASASSSPPTSLEDRFQFN